ncbi:methyltransferase domain-containing protein [Paenibacillus sp. SYP-B3998]|uniref:Methyltransferase domain-containing protein n=1 Tax=Paenibacillus sp. SYP-B3998 TaxID=2678564 RepID=A0A6G3ZWM9_9BACL|nr:class I SAM-dependent methyltransferase [Paenibacillus sp. SYP-B3998]NEW06626.1 methyltransferase domain-containing protein [Paenibacillus sp. SYP-B3998]
MAQDYCNPINTQFDEIASKYDTQRKMLIPCFDDLYQIASSLVQTTAEIPNILDLGAGTGLFSSFILANYASAKLTLIDLSGAMLDIAKQRLDSFAPNITYITGDYCQYEYPEAYDCIISSLSIHHLEDDEKHALYKRIFSLLKPGGVFVNADQVLGDSPFLQSLNRSDWETKIKKTALDPEALKAAYERTKLDKMATLDQQLRWLQEAGFTDVDCVYKYYNFVVMHARKI